MRTTQALYTVRPTKLCLTASAPNNGSYTWVEDGYNSPLEYRYNSGAPSGCNYSIALKVWTDTVYSGYFTIINPDDGGLATDAQCPEIGSSIGPMEQTCAFFLLSQTRSRLTFLSCQ